MNKISFFKNKLATNSQLIFLFLLVFIFSLSFIKIAEAKNIVIGTTDIDMVGIGIDDPMAKLQINPSVGMEGLRIITSSYSPFVIRDAANTRDLFRIWQNGDITTSGSVIGSNSYWNLSGNNLFASSTAWNLGIGTINPTYKLQVQKTSTAPALMIGGGYAGSPRLQIFGLDADANAYMGLGTDMGGGPYELSMYTSNYSGMGKITFGTYNGTTYNQKMIVDNAGNIGIGTNAPAVRLDVEGGASTYGTNIYGMWTPDGNSLIRNWSLNDGINNYGTASQGVYTSITDAPMGSKTMRYSSSTNWRNQQWIPVDITRTYKVSLWGRTISGTPNNYISLTQAASDLSQSVNGGWGNPYWGIVNQAFPATWTYYSMTIGPSGSGSDYTWTSTTKYVQLGALMIYTGSGVCEIAGYKMEEVPNTVAGDTTGLGDLIVNGNVGIGSTVPAFKLAVSGTGSFTQPVIVGSPTATNHAATKSYVDSVASSAAGGGVGTGASGQTLRSNGTSWISNSTLYNNGTNVGIGTTVPSAKLQVNGDVTLSGAYDNAQLNFAANTTNIIIGTTRTDNTVPGYIKSNGWGNFSFSSGLAVGYDWPNSWQSGMIINGSVGIGTTNPAAKLEVNGFTNIATTNGNAANGYSGNTDDLGMLLVSTPSTGSAGINVRNYYGTSQNMEWGNSGIRLGSRITTNSGLGNLYLTSGSDSVFLTGLANGNVGIGSTVPAFKLAVSGTGSFSQPVIVGTPTSASHAATKSYVDSAVSALGVGSGSSGQTLRNNGTSWVASSALYNNGTNVGIGTTAAKHKLDVIGNVGIGLAASGYSDEGANLHIWSSDVPVVGYGIGGANPANILIEENDVEQSLAFLGPNSATQKIVFGRTSDSGAGQISFNHNTSQYGIIGGDVGIGTSVPRGRLSIEGGEFSILNGSSAITHFNYAGTSANYIRGTFTQIDTPTYFMGGNVGIGTTNPLSKLHVNSGALAASGITDVLTFQMQYATGNEVPRIKISNAANTTFASLDFPLSPNTSSGAIAFNTSNNGTLGEVMRINGNGNVGIGTATPNSKLQVVGGIYANGTVFAGNGNLEATYASNEGPSLVLRNPNKSTTGNYWQIYNMTGVYGNSLQFWSYGSTNSGGKLILNDTGGMNLLGDFNAYNITLNGKDAFNGGDSWLRLNGSNAFTSGIYLGSGITRTDGTFQVGPGGDKMIVSTNVGIGTTAPGSKLDILDSSSDLATLRIGSAGNAAIDFYSYDAPSRLTYTVKGNISVLEDANSSGIMLFKTADGYSTLSEKMRITADGSVGIGTNNPATTLDVNGMIRFNGFASSNMPPTCPIYGGQDGSYNNGGLTNFGVRTWGQLSATNIDDNNSNQRYNGFVGHAGLFMNDNTAGDDERIFWSNCTENFVDNSITFTNPGLLDGASPITTLVPGDFSLVMPGRLRKAQGSGATPTRRIYGNYQMATYFCREFGLNYKTFSYNTATVSYDIWNSSNWVNNGSASVPYITSVTCN